MKNNMIRNITRCLVLTALMSMWAPQELWAKDLITSANQLWSNAPDDSGGEGLLENLGVLLDGNVGTFWHADYNGKYNSPYLQVKLNETVKAGEFVYFTIAFRNHYLYLDYPARFNVQVSADGTKWFKNCEWNVEYTGPGTWTTTPGMKMRYDCNYIKLECTQSFIPNRGKGWSFALSELQISTDHSTTATNVGDPSNSTSNCGDAISGYIFTHTRSILDARNRDMEPNSNLSKYWKIDGFDANGKWTRDTEALAKMGIKMPDYGYFDNTHDSRIKSGVRQPAHIVEHDLYVLPGSAVILEPYSDLPWVTTYQENYIRWYDYATDCKSPNLAPAWEDWFVPANKSGMYGGMGMVKESRYDLIINNIDQYMSFVNRVNAGDNTLSALLTVDLDFNGKTVQPVGTLDHPYMGRFNGDGHTIRNMVMKGSSKIGMFGCVAGGAVIKNLFFDSTCSFEAESYAAPVAYVDGDSHGSGKILIENIWSACTSLASGTDAAGVFGCNGNSGQAQIEIVNCMACGNVTVSSSTVSTASGIAAWMGQNGKSLIKNSYSKVTFGGGVDTGSPFARGTRRMVNCYSTMAQDGVAWNDNYPVNINRLDSRYWKTDASKEYVPTFAYDDEGNHALGTIMLYYAPEGEGVTETTIAADISQSYVTYSSRNLDRKSKALYEPALMVRHLFNIKDGAKQAEEMSGSKSNNEKYIEEHRREVSARAGADFQVRLDIPLPDESSTRSDLYYKDTDGSYKSIPNWEMRVYTKDGKEVKNFFNKMAPISFRVARTTGGMATQEHNFSYTGMGGSEQMGFYRMIGCNAADAKAGTYVVKLLAQDENYKPINIYGTSDPLLLMEYEVTFEPEEKASFLNEATLGGDDKYRRHRPDYLTEKYGEPQAKVDYDEYLLLEGGQTASNDYIVNVGYAGSGFQDSEYSEKSKMFKWPLSWEDSNYGFGYENRHDYAMYMVANHSWAVPYQEAAAKVTNEENFGKGKGLRDRLFYDTRGEKMGYFYYVNAATDPGVCATAHIDQICAGSTIHVSAWVAECSATNEVANLILNFNAKLKDGRNVTLHSFVTGYVDRKDLGHWVHVYYSFIPNLTEFGITSADVESYTVVLENNCVSSQGADYAVDDIRVFVSKPTVLSQQLEPVCSEKIAPKTLIYAPIDELLTSNGLVEAEDKASARKLNLFYSFVDKQKYDEARKAGKDGVTAYNTAVLRYEYMPGQGSTQTFGRLSFSTFYEDNPEYQVESGVGTTAYRNSIDGDRCLCFNTFPNDNGLRPGKEYYVSIYTEDQNIVNPTTSPGATEFNIEDNCSKTCVMRVRSSSVIKVDGVIVQDIDGIVVCENQQPTIQLDLLGKSAGEEIGLRVVEENARIDWYAGSADEYYAESAGGVYLSDALMYFREAYPEGSSLDVQPSGQFTEAMRQYLLSMTAAFDADGKPVTPKLLLWRASYTFPPVSRTAEYVYVTAVHINKEYGNMQVCTSPTEVRVKVYNHAPSMTDGFVQINSYPDGMTDVPLRIGLDQLKSVSAPVAQAKTFTRHLAVPVKKVLPVTEGATDMKVASDDNVYLSATNDPAYKNLQNDPDNSSADGLLPVGLLQTIKAAKDGQDNQFEIVFYSDQFQFHEGYYYSLKFGFEEVVRTVETVPCSGELVFTIKVVPKYQKWTGGENTNWNNDANWARVSSSELYRTGDVSQDSYVTDGDNALSTSYAPLEFTHAIITAGVPAPRMYGVAATEVSLPGRGTYRWNSAPGEDATGNAQPEPTLGVQFDMAAETATSGHVLCRPWYANTCREVNFTPNSEMLAQQHLSYTRAWVEMNLATGRWYTLCSPLKSVVAGDMYLPTQGARQVTELFVPITFNTTDYNRFSPAVYQRAWNKAKATVYEIGGSSRNVAVQTTWSRVYNDVDEDYSHGEGFSIKVDASRQSSPVDECLLRLPKDDASYSYYSDYTTGNVSGNNTPIDRGGTAYRLNDTHGKLTASSAGNSRYFLIANPFMAHLDMKEFLSRNSDKLNPKYWILTSDSQQSAVMDPSAGTFVGSMADAGFVAPMQSFFVEAKDGASSIELAYDESMMQVDVTDKSQTGWLLAPSYREDPSGQTRSASISPDLCVTALVDGKVMSRALLHARQGASAGYDEAEDVALISDDMQERLARVYTVAGNMAVNINSLPRIDSTEVGVLAAEGENVTLRFDNVDESQGLTLCDTQTGQETPLTEGMVYAVKGSVTGRLFLRASGRQASESGIQIQTQGNVLIVTDLGGSPLGVNVYAANGVRVATLDSADGHARVTLPRGVYVVEARSEHENETKTVIIP